MTERFALYFAPQADSALAAFGDRWLGRSVETGADLGPPDDLPGQLRERWKSWTESPRFYGFHGTLKPPFPLAGGKTQEELREATAGFAAGRHAFEMPPLKLHAIGSFLALVPSAPCAALDSFAAETVEYLDAFRASPSDQELAKRRSAGLTDRQEALLQKWGYPYVMEEFRFHLTLSSKLDSVEHAFAMTVLKPMVQPLTEDPVPVTELALYHQPGPALPFVLQERFKLRSAA